MNQRTVWGLGEQETPIDQVGVAGAFGRADVRAAVHRRRRDWPSPGRFRPAGGTTPGSQVRDAGRRPARRRPARTGPAGPSSTRDVAPFLQNLAMSLGGYVAIFSGEFAQFPEQLVDEYLAPGQRREPMVARNWYMTDCEWPLFLFKYANPDPVSRRGALELSYECVRFLSRDRAAAGSGARPCSASTTASCRARNLLDFHANAPFPEVARLWRQSLLSEAEYAVLPEIGGWGAALGWSYEGLQAAHDHIAQVTSRPETRARGRRLDGAVRRPGEPAGRPRGRGRGRSLRGDLVRLRRAAAAGSTRPNGCSRTAAGSLGGCWPARSTPAAPGSPWRRRCRGSWPDCPGPPAPSSAPDTIGFVTDVEELFAEKRGKNPLVKALAELSAQRDAIVAPVTRGLWCPVR